MGWQDKELESLCLTVDFELGAELAATIDLDGLDRKGKTLPHPGEVARHHFGRCMGSDDALHRSCGCLQISEVLSRGAIAEGTTRTDGVVRGLVGAEASRQISTRKGTSRHW